MLPDRRLSALFDLLMQALDVGTESEWWAMVAATLTGSVFSAGVVAVNVINPTDSFGWFSRVYPRSAQVRMPVNSPMDYVLTHDHPFSVRARAGPITAPLQISDLVSSRQWRDLAAYERMRYLTGGHHHMIVPVPRSAPYIESVSLVRPDRGFDASEVALATRLQVVVQLATRQLRHVEQRERRWGPLAVREVAEAGAALALTAREQVVLDLLASGLTTEKISAELSISPRTVYKHEQHLYRKLGVHDALGCLLRARRLGLVRDPDQGLHAEPTGASMLTHREQRVLDLIAIGMSNAAIADTLFISPRTVDHHVTNVLRKLDVRTRAEAVAVGFRRGLLR